MSDKPATPGTTPKLSIREREAADAILDVIACAPRKEQINILWQTCVLLGEFGLATRVLQHVE